MAAVEGSNLLENVLTEYSSRFDDNSKISDNQQSYQRHNSSDNKEYGWLNNNSQIGKKDETPEMKSPKSSGFVKKIAPVKPRRKSNAPGLPAMMDDKLDFGEPLDFESIMSTVRANSCIENEKNTDSEISNELSTLTHKGSAEISGEKLNEEFKNPESNVFEVDETKNYTGLSLIVDESRPSSRELEAEYTRLMSSDAWFGEDLGFASDGEMRNLTDDEGFDNNSATLTDFSKRRQNEVGENRTMTNNDARPLYRYGAHSGSVQSELNYVGLDHSPKKRFGRFGSTRYKFGKGSRDTNDKIQKKEFGQLLDTAAINASTAYAKFRKFKKNKIQDIRTKKDEFFDKSPKRGTPMKSNGPTVMRNGRANESPDEKRKFSSQSEGSIASSGGTDKSFNIRHQRVIRSGWLKKQSGMMKTWNERWFILKGDLLSYYKDKDESKLLGHVEIRGNHVIEHPMRTNEPNKYLFEIVPGGDKDNLSKNHASLMLSTNTANDRDEWVRVLKKETKSPTRGIFGQELFRTIQYEEGIPYIIVQCCEFIRQNNGFQEEGIFRLPGQANQVQELQDSFGIGERPSIDKHTDAHTVASLIKSFLRQLPEPLIPFNMYNPLIEAAKLANPGNQSMTRQMMSSTTEVESDDVIDAREVIKRELKTLPKENFDLLRYLCQFLDDVRQYSDRNKMDVANLALMFGPNIIRSEKTDPVLIMSHTTYVQYIMSEFIENHKYLFPSGEFAVLPKQSSIPDVAADAASRDNMITSTPMTSRHNAFTDTVMSTHTAMTSTTDGFNTMTTHTTSPPGTIGMRHVTDDSGTGSLGPTPDNTSRRVQPPQINVVKQRNGQHRPKPASAILEEGSVTGRSSTPALRPALPSKPTKPVRRVAPASDVNRRESFYDNVTQSSETSSYVNRKNPALSQRSSYANQTSPGVSSQRSSTNAVAGSSVDGSFHSFDGDTLPYSPAHSIPESVGQQRIPSENGSKPIPPFRKRRTKRGDSTRQIPGSAVTNNQYLSDEESNTESVPPDDRSDIRSSRNGSVSSVNDSTYQRGHRSYSASKRPSARPPPPPYPHRDRSQSSGIYREPTYDELKEDIKILQEKLHKQSGEYEARTRYMEESLIRQIQELRCSTSLPCFEQPSLRTESFAGGRMSQFSESSPSQGQKSGTFFDDAGSYIGSVADSVSDSIQYDPVTGRFDIDSKSVKDFKSQDDQLQHLQKCVVEERKLRQMTEIQLKNEKRGRVAAEERNEQLQKEMKEFFNTFGSMFNLNNSETSSVQ